MEKIDEGSSKEAENFWHATDAAVTGLEALYPTGTFFGKLTTDFAKGAIGPDSDEYNAIKALSNLTVILFKDLKNSMQKIESELKYRHFLEDYDSAFGINIEHLRTGIKRLFNGVYDAAAWHRFCLSGDNTTPESVLQVRFCLCIFATYL
uniref:Uncharacterized protein n=1 Tax=Panagrolaimus davidi TaxID=227884 RepID=A0A914Q3L4_9BILA